MQHASSARVFPAYCPPTSPLDPIQFDLARSSSVPVGDFMFQ